MFSILIIVLVALSFWRLARNILEDFNTLKRIRKKTFNKMKIKFVWIPAKIFISTTWLNRKDYVKCRVSYIYMCVSLSFFSEFSRVNTFEIIDWRYHFHVQSTKLLESQRDLTSWLQCTLGQPWWNNSHINEVKRVSH